MGARCIFDWLVAFVGLVGLYACRVKRLRTEKRNAANFWGCFALAVACIALLLLSLGLLLVLLRSCCLWVSLGLWVVLLVFLFPFGRYDKRKGGLFGSSSLCSWVVVCLPVLYV